jgi:hypothetical protein
MMQDVERVADVIERELGIQEMVLADPITLRRLMAKRIAAAISAMTPDTNYARGWNDGIEAAKWAVVGYIHPDHGRLPGEAFASAQIDKLKKPTGN